MGNHAAGVAMESAAREEIKNRNGESALVLLDRICSPWRGTDAEFESQDPANPGLLHPQYDDVLDPRAALGSLVLEAFAPGKSYPGMLQDPADPHFDAEAEERDLERWWDEVRTPFKKRYDFW